MGGACTVLVLLLTALSFLNAQVAWAYLLFVYAFEGWLLHQMRSVGRGPVGVAEPPYHFTDDEAQLVARYRFYFTYPAVSHAASSVIAAIGLSALVLTPWLIYKQQFAAAALIGVNVLAVARFTKALAPLMALRMRAAKGDRAALHMLELHDPLWRKIREANKAV